MAFKFKVEPAEHTVPLVCVAAYAAWKVSGVFGMGRLQDQGDLPPGPVLQNMLRGGDYDVMGTNNPYNIKSSKPGELEGDYVFGRMMKFHLAYDPNTGIITAHDGDLSPEYESWCLRYPTYEKLLQAAVERLQQEHGVVVTVNQLEEEPVIQE